MPGEHDLMSDTHDLFLETLRRYERPLIRYAHGYTGDLEDARDIVQDVFVKLSQNLATLDHERVTQDDLEASLEKLVLGSERRILLSPEERRRSAYHEAGHAIVGRLVPEHDPVYKVSVIPRGRALGVTMSLPEKDRYSYDREYMLNQISMLFGGRIAEEVFMNQMTTGASNDFERATEIARNMVTRYGMSDVLGPMVYGENEGEVFLGRSITTHKNVSEATMQQVDAEIRRIIERPEIKLARLLESLQDRGEQLR